MIKTRRLLKRSCFCGKLKQMSNAKIEISLERASQLAQLSKAAIMKDREERISIVKDEHQEIHQRFREENEQYEKLSFWSRFFTTHPLTTFAREREYIQARYKRNHRDAVLAHSDDLIIVQEILVMAGIVDPTSWPEVNITINSKTAEVLYHWSNRV